MNSSLVSEVADPGVKLSLGLVLVAKEKEGCHDESNKAGPEDAECCHCNELVERQSKKGSHEEEDLSGGDESLYDSCAFSVYIHGHFFLRNEF